MAVFWRQLRFEFVEKLKLRGFPRLSSDALTPWGRSSDSAHDNNSRDATRKLCGSLGVDAVVEEMKIIAELIHRVLSADEDKEDEVKYAAFKAEMEAVKADVHVLTAKFPLY